MTIPLREVWMVYSKVWPTLVYAEHTLAERIGCERARYDDSTTVQWQPIASPEELGVVGTACRFVDDPSPHTWQRLHAAVTRMRTPEVDP